MLLDTTYNIATPEGVELRLPVAGLASRSLAWLIDALIKFAILLVASIFFQLFGELGGGLLLIGMFLPSRVKPGEEPLTEPMIR